MTFITNLLNQYGYIVLYLALTLELIAFPLPGETLMLYCGFLIFKGHLDLTLCILFATLGIVSGITISYFLGKKLGRTFFTRYGPKFHMGEKQLDKISSKIDRYGTVLFVIAYFIPGVRHITGYFCGITKIPYKKFAITTYVGAFIWSTTFISIGKLLGDKWNEIDYNIGTYIFAYIHKYLFILILIVVVAILGWLIFKSNKKIYLLKRTKLRRQNMFKEMRRKDRQLNNEESIGLLETGEYGVLSTVNESGYSYGVPLSYAYFNKCIYFHGATDGSKLDNINYNNKVSFCVIGKTDVLADKFSTNYESVVVFGKAYEVIDEEKEAVLLELIKKYSSEYMEQGKKYIKNAVDKTKVIKIDIEHISGKARK